jgi:hypothetical protein
MQSEPRQDASIWAACAVFAFLFISAELHKMKQGQKAMNSSKDWKGSAGFLFFEQSI